MEKNKNTGIGQVFERVLWRTRWAVLLAVVCSILAALIMFYVSAADTYYAVQTYSDYYLLDTAAARDVMRAEAVGAVVKIIDIFLLAIVLMIFGLGLYELYISKIDHAYEDDDESAAHMLSINDLDDLKSRLGKVIMMILIVKFFEMAIGMQIESIRDLLIFGGGIFLIAVTLFASEKAARKGGQWKTRSSDRAGSADDRRSE